MPDQKRTTDELILMLLTAAGTTAVLPFAIMRFMQQSWALFALDSILIVGLGALTAYVYITRRVQLASYAVAVLSLVAMLGTVYVAGAGQLNWMYPTILVVFYLVPPLHSLALTVIGFSVMLPHLMEILEPAALMTTLFTIALNVAFCYAFSSQKESQRARLQHVATKDPLTGAENRRGLASRLRGLIARHQRKPINVSLILIDLDEFKRINDQFGHAVGDEVLVGVVKVLRQRVRRSDSIYRIGGEEFLIVADNTGQGSGHDMAEDLRVLIEATRLIEGYPVTASIGVARIVPGEDYDSWVKRADDALYEAKHSGRNRVVHALADGTLSVDPAAAVSASTATRIAS